MLVTTILNKIEEHKGFVFGKARMVIDETAWERIEVAVRPRKNGKARCSACGKPAPSYDRLKERRFRYVPLWGIAVMLVYAMRRREGRTGSVGHGKVSGDAFAGALPGRLGQAALLAGSGSALRCGLAPGL